MIPKVIHHIWIGKKIFPHEYATFLQKWKLLYPDYNFIYWNDMLVESSDILSDDIKQYYYSNCNIALKADLLRFKILEKYGGIYIDVDTEPLKRMSDEICNFNFFSGYQPNNQIAIGIMGSKIREPLVSKYIVAVLKNIPNYTDDLGNISEHIQPISGPEFFTQHLTPYINNSIYKFFESKYFYPYSWIQMNRRYENFNLTSPDSYSVHHWGKNW